MWIVKMVGIFSNWVGNALLASSGNLWLDVGVLVADAEIGQQVEQIDSFLFRLFLFKIVIIQWICSETDLSYWTDLRFLTSKGGRAKLMRLGEVGWNSLK